MNQKDQKALAPYADLLVVSPGLAIERLATDEGLSASVKASVLSAVRKALIAGTVRSAVERSIVTPDLDLDKVIAELERADSEDGRGAAQMLAGARNHIESSWERRKALRT